MPDRFLTLGPSLLPLPAGLVELAIPLGEDLLLPPEKSVAGRDVAQRAVERPVTRFAGEQADLAERIKPIEGLDAAALRAADSSDGRW